MLAQAIAAVTASIYLATSGCEKRDHAGSNSSISTHDGPTRSWQSILIQSRVDIAIAGTCLAEQQMGGGGRGAIRSVRLADALVHRARPAGHEVRHLGGAKQPSKLIAPAPLLRDPHAPWACGPRWPCHVITAVLALAFSFTTEDRICCCGRSVARSAAMQRSSRYGTKLLCGGKGSVEDAPGVRMDVAVGGEVDLILHEDVVVGALQRLRVVALSLQRTGMMPCQCCTRSTAHARVTSTSPMAMLPYAHTCGRLDASTMVVSSSGVTNCMHRQGGAAISARRATNAAGEPGPKAKTWVCAAPWG